MDERIDASPLERLLRRAVRAAASDVHLTAGQPPLIRVAGDLAALPGYADPLPAEGVELLITGILTPAQHDDFYTHGEVDLSYTAPGIGRFRVNVFRQLGEIAAALRLVPGRVYGFDELGVPPIVRDLALRPRGLVLVTGPTGSGKSTTLTAMVDVINRTRPAHVVTIEDPIEFVHRSRRSLIHQREIGADTGSFGEALRRVLRQDPDVILIGELRDTESIQAALSAAETGHLVLSTLHTQGAAKSINRIVDAFESSRQQQVRAQLGDTLQGILSQTLVPRAQDPGLTVATEVLVNTPAVANLIREGQVAQLHSAMQAGRSLGMHTLDQDLARLVGRGEVARHVARATANDPATLDGVHVQPADLDAEAWSLRAGDVRELERWGSAS